MGGEGTTGDYSGRMATALKDTKGLSKVDVLIYLLNQEDIRKEENQL